MGQLSKVRIGRLASRQGGRITRAQLRQLGVGTTTIDTWLGTGYLYARLPGVYAVGQPGAPLQARQWEAILYAGPGAMLSHMSAAWWLGLILHAPDQVHVSTPRRVRRRRGFVVHDRRRLERVTHRGVPVTDHVHTVLDLAAVRPALVRRALGVLDFEHRLDAGALLALCGRGRPGAATLRTALGDYDPRFANTLSVLEDDFLLACEALDIPKPDEVNVRIHGVLCDAVYREAKVIVELDGTGNHHSPAQIRRDRANDLMLRAHGWLVLRYSWSQVHEDPAAIRDDILRELAARATSAV